MRAVLSLLRAAIAMMVGGFVSVCGQQWIAGEPARYCGAVTCRGLLVWLVVLHVLPVLPRQGAAMAAVSGLLLALSFLWFRHVYLALLVLLRVVP